jgi:hypothetical protein
MINNNPISYETKNTIQNYALDKKEEINQKEEQQKETIRTAAVYSSQVKQTENIINTYLNNDSNEVDLMGSNIDYSEVTKKYTQYNQQKEDKIEELYSQVKEHVNNEYSTIQNKGNFINMSV